ncbi:hypothetical protein [Micromonospora sp. NPDC007230]|uniref:hypothetical protein n=1 Tax=Micromonospora sp. NPDC007230 TaxID=3364237 RepID=UPI0036A2D2A4
MIMSLAASARRCAYLLVLALTCLFLVVPSNAASASPADLCVEPLADMQAVMGKIEAHNAKPRLFELPRQRAAYNAYNAEARHLNREKTKALSRLRNCVKAMKTLEDTAAGSPELGIPKTPTLKNIEDAIKKVPAGWRPPPPPVRGNHWRVPPGLKPIYDVLRPVSPPRFGNVPLRGQPRPAINAPDPAYPPGSGYRIGRLPGGRSKVTPDHIIPLTEIMQMPGFLRLTPRNMYHLVNARVNLQWLSKKANDSKSSRSVAGMTGVDPAWQASQVLLEDKVRRILQDAINTLLKSQR